MIALLLCIGMFPMRAAGEMHTVDEVQGLIDGIVAYKLQTAGAGSVQDWINGPLTGGAGTTAEWYIIGITQSRGEDVSAYRNALERYLEENAVSSATSREKYALALIAAGGTSPYITETLDNSIGQQGIMSWIYGLHILNNGYTCESYTADQVADMLLTLQYPDGGWALFGDYGDIDVTAMTLQALAPFVPYRGDVQAAADRGIAFLAERQQEGGGYKSFGTANAESTAQVLCALSALGIDCNTDPRFIKEDHTILDGLLQYRLEDGSFSHLAGDGFNETATVQAYYSLIAYQRMCSGRSPLLVLDRRQPIAQPVTDPPQTEAITTEQQQNAVTEAPSAGTLASGSTATTAASGTTAAATVTTAVSSGSVTESGSTVQSSSFLSATSTVQPETVISSLESTTSGTVTSVMQPPPENTQGVGYKPIAILAIIAAGAIVSIVLVILKKRHVKNFLFVVIVCIPGSAVVLLTDIRSAQDYYQNAPVHKEHAIGTVTLEIRCDTVVGKSDAEYIPEDGVILPATTFEIAEGDSVFTILTEAAQQYGIHVENTGSSANAHGMVYIAGINYLYEYEFGDLSGWVYHVNGISPSRGCGDYLLSDGDVIEWLYTCDLGRDLNEVYEQ